VSGLRVCLNLTGGLSTNNYILESKPMDDLYIRKAKPDPNSRYPQGAYDGDTIDLIVDLGFTIVSSQRIRLLGLNTPEIRGKEKEEGFIFRTHTRTWLASHCSETQDWPLIIRTLKDTDSFGRYLAYVESSDTGLSLNDHLLALGSPVYSRKKIK
jgi:micrococcal nuclease